MGTQKSFQENQRLRLDRDYFTRSGRGLRRPSLAWPSLSYLRSSSQMHARRHAEDRPRGPRPQAGMRTISPNQSPEPTLTIRPPSTLQRVQVSVLDLKSGVEGMRVDLGGRRIIYHNAAVL